MPKYSKRTGVFRVKISYRKNKQTGTVAVPAPLLQVWGQPTHLVFSGNNGVVIIKPISEVNQSGISEETHSNSSG